MTGSGWAQSMKLPLDIGPIHFIGIGGIGMSGIAEICTISATRCRAATSPTAPMSSGSRAWASRSRSATTPRISTAPRWWSSPRRSSRTIPNSIAARAQPLPLVRRAEMLAEMMRLKCAIAIAGTHGKTTTTTLVAALLEAARLDPTVINGGIINAYGTNARLGAGEWMVVEADESDGTFLRLPATIAVVTNIDPEHLDFYGTFESDARGLRALRREHAVLRLRRAVHRPSGSAGDDRPRSPTAASSPMAFSPQADVRAVDVRSPRRRRISTCVFTDRAQQPSAHDLDRLELPMLGRTQCAERRWPRSRWRTELGVGDDVMRAALAEFKGVKRRFTKIGEWNGVAIIDDYAHHPGQDRRRAAAPRAQRLYGPGRRRGAAASLYAPARSVRAILHLLQRRRRGDRRRVYAAGEAPIEGVDRDALVEGLRAHGHRNVITLDGAGGARRRRRDLAKPGGYRRLPRRRLDHATGPTRCRAN